MPCKGGSPGPAYGLPTLTGYDNHDLTKFRAPAFSLGQRTKTVGITVTPGPYGIGDFDRYGKLPYQGWTIAPRINVKGKTTAGPGPAAYKRENKPPYTPAWSIGLKLNTKKHKRGPGPADYFPTTQQTAGWSLGTRCSPGKKFVTPGPGSATLTDNYKPKAPAFSLGLRDKKASAKTPGPGPAYFPKRRICKEPPHSYSFGLRHSECSPPLITFDDYV